MIMPMRQELFQCPMQKDLCTVKPGHLMHKICQNISLVEMECVGVFLNEVPILLRGHSLAMPKHNSNEGISMPRESHLCQRQGIPSPWQASIAVGADAMEM